MFEKSISNDAILFPCGMSRSGTTLLTTVFDSHSNISLGYELLPAELPAPDLLIANLEKVSSEIDDEALVSIGKGLRKKGLSAEGLFAVRVARSGVPFSAYISLLKDLIAQGYGKTESIPDRFRISYEVVKRKAVIEDSMLKGFKLNNSSYSLAHKLFPNSYYIYILRDPRDVWVSHIKCGFKRTVEEVCKAWINYLEKFEQFSKQNSKIAILIRYEDLVTIPEKVVNSIFNMLPLNVEPSVFEFYKSNATVHSVGHPNSKQLSQDFFTSSINRWKNNISLEDRSLIEKKCGSLMVKYGY